MSKTKSEEREWRTVISIMAIEDSDVPELKGQFYIQTQHYYFHTLEEAKRAAHDLKDIFNDNCAVKWGAKFDEDMKLGSN